MKSFAVVRRLVRRLALWALLPAVLGNAASRPARAQDEAAETASHTWALLIGVEKYHHASPLQYTTNDIVELGATLRTYGGVPSSHLLEIVDSAKLPACQPLRSSILKEVPAWLKKPTEDDTVIVYFSGHGFRDAQNRMYLAPIDCDPANPEETGISITWLREQLAGCKAKVRMLVLDACHAGSEKGDDERASVAADELGRPFVDLERMLTLASSTAAQKSLIWEEVQQSLFSYWLCQGLKGHADTDLNGTVEFDELYGYVHNHVVSTAEDRFQRKQTPIRIVRSGTPGVPTVIALQPQPLKTIVADLVEQLAIELQQRKIKTVGIVDFVDHSGPQTLAADRNFGALGKWCARELQDEFTRQSQGRFNVIPAETVLELLKEQKFSPANLSSPAALRRLAAEAGDLPVLAIGRFKSRNGSLLNMEVTLQQTRNIEPAGRAAGFAQISADLWAMIGHSVEITDDDYLNPIPRDDHPVRNIPFVMIPKLDRRAKESHPLESDDLPYRVRIFVAGRERKPRFEGNDAFITLKRDEVFEVEIENRSGKNVLMRLLIDGLNTIPEKDLPKPIAGAELKGISTMLWAQRVSLETARVWELNPKHAQVFRVRGFYSRVDGKNSEYREFKVVDVGQSLAARQNFTDQIGLITAAFYIPIESSIPVESPRRGLGGVGEGETKIGEVARGNDLRPGNLIAVLNLRYGDSDDREN